MSHFFTVPVTSTISGWIGIRAENKEDAIRQAKKMNEEGIDPDDIQDWDINSEVYVDELEGPPELDEP